MIEPNETRAQQSRENAEPEEAIRPMPLSAVLIALGMVIWAVVYILVSEPLDTSQWGDQRSLAELSGEPVSATGDGAATVDGKAVYAAQCVACHQATGAGLPGVFPPLDGSEWVAGSERVLANILLHGIDGEIEVLGTTYKGSMPPFERLSDVELAAIATWLRASWSNRASPIDASIFEQERAAQRRTTPFENGTQLEALVAAPGT